MIGRKVIVRAKAGVFFGTLVKLEGEMCTLEKTRKLWYWDGAGAVEGIAVNGVTKHENCKFTVWVDELILSGVTQIIPTTNKAATILEEVREWKV